MTVKGKVYLIADEQVISDKFKKREIVIETNDQYPQFIPVQFTQDKCGLLDAFRVGETVEININLRGNKYNKDGTDRFFLSLDGWKISQSSDNDAPPVGSHATSVNTAKVEEVSDLPF